MLRRFGDIATWHPAIAESRIEGDVPDGTPDCVRVLLLADGSTLRESLLAVDAATIATEHQYAAHSTRSRSAGEGTQHVVPHPNKR